MTRIIWTVLAWLASSLALSAEGYPALHDVTDVAANDVLNVRQSPEAGALLVGTLAHDARGVEVIREDDGWGLVNLGEVSGWASLRFLARRVDGDLPNTSHSRCFGTEPFWGLNITQGATARLTSPEDMEGAAYNVGLYQRLQSPLEKFVMQGQGASGEITLIVTPAYCDDGMSDREFGLDATVILSGDMPRVYSGCCSLTD
jgi:uncharacterized membrane protein